MGSISACHADDPGSIPGRGVFSIYVVRDVHIYAVRDVQIYCNGDLAQMVERSLSMREALGSMPRFSILFCSSVARSFENRDGSSHSNSDPLL